LKPSCYSNPVQAWQLTGTFKLGKQNQASFSFEKKIKHLVPASEVMMMLKNLEISIHPLTELS
jgi:hypothetical protein